MQQPHEHTFDVRDTGKVFCLECRRYVVDPGKPPPQDAGSSLGEIVRFLNALADSVGILNPGPSRDGMPHYDARDLLSRAA